MRSASAVQALETMLRPKPRLVRRECRRCGIRHTGVYEGCATCLELERGVAAAWRKGQKLKKLCQACVEKWDRGSISRCTHHLAADNAYQQERIADQREKGLCAYGRCQTATDGEWYCAEHAAKRNELARKPAAARRQSLPARRRA